jgi:hypothetical protein
MIDNLLFALTKVQFTVGTDVTWWKPMKIWAASRQNQRNSFATSMDPDQPAHPHSLIRIHAVRLQTLLQVENLIANSMDPDQTARMRRLVWIHAGRKRITLVLSWRGLFDYPWFTRYSEGEWSPDTTTPVNNTKKSFCLNSENFTNVINKRTCQNTVDEILSGNK